jgi:cold-inducible RNA-binding protein
MNTKLYVGNLAAITTEKDLHGLFSAHGNVAEVNLPVERETGRLRGFAIVTMATPQGARAAILALNGKELEARALTVAEYVPGRKVPLAAGQKGKFPGAVVGQNAKCTVSAADTWQIARSESALESWKYLNR